MPKYLFYTEVEDKTHKTQSYKIEAQSDAAALAETAAQFRSYYRRIPQDIKIAARVLVHSPFIARHL